MRRAALVDKLLSSQEPSVRWRVMVGVLGEDPESSEVRRIQQDIRGSARVKNLLSGRDQSGRLVRGSNVYMKWQGAHWAIAALADIGYPCGDQALQPIAEQLLDFWLSDGYYTEFEADSTPRSYGKQGVPLMRGRYRAHASQQGNALDSFMRLGLTPDRLPRLVERLLHWQWPDGGWNCDRVPSADTSSFMETLLPMRGLWRYGIEHRDVEAQQAARRAAEVFLSRRLFKRRSNGEVIHSSFVQLHYPLYWHYDYLAGLKAMAELGLIGDARCADALDLLESKELESGGWPAESRYYHLAAEVERHADCVDWGPAGKTRMNEWVTTDALYVLRHAGRA